MKQSEIRTIGYKALIDSLGVVVMLRFLQQLDIGKGDYTRERHSAIEPTFSEYKQFLANLTESSINHKE
jgi:hypothetical protein